MSKISLTTYEEDKEIRKNLTDTDSTESDPHWNDWFKLALLIEPPIEDKIEVDKTSANSKANDNDNDIIEKDGLNILAKESSTRSNRRRYTARAKKRFLSTAIIAIKNYGKREEDSTHYKSMMCGKTMVLRTHPCIRSINLAKRFEKISQNA